MKIKKKKLIESALLEDEVAPGVEVDTTTQGGVTTTTVDGQTDKNGEPTPVVKKVLRNAITEALDDIYASTMSRRGLEADGLKVWGTSKNLLIEGLPGSSKTASVKGWCEARGIKFFELDVRDDELAVTLNGAPYFEQGKDMPDGTRTQTKIHKAPSDALDPLDDEDGVILFLDELNRQKDRGIRGSLLKLVAEKIVLDATRPGGVRHFPNLLFTVAAINPPDPKDDGLTDLDDAEKRRYNVRIVFNSTPETAREFIEFSYGDNLINLSKLYVKPGFDKERYWKLLSRFIYCQDIGKFILDDASFKFDGNEESRQTKREHKTLFNQASFTDIIFDTGRIFTDDPRVTVAKFTSALKQAFTKAQFLDQTTTMLKRIIDKYHPADLVTLVKGQENLLGVNLGSKELAAKIGGGAGGANNGGGFGSGGLADDTEDTTGVFNGAGTNSGNDVSGATESDEQVKERVMDYFGNLDPFNP